MSSALKTVGIIAVLILLVVFYSATFVVSQTQQALVLRFGGVRQVISSPGLYFKVPLIESVVYLDKRVLDLNLPEQEVIASDQKRLVVDAFTRYRITDPVRFYQTVSNVAGANLRLANIINSTVRQFVADATFTEIVRTRREELMQRIRQEVNTQANGLGISVVDVRLRRVDLPQQNSQAVFQRMQTERQREAADIRAQGSELAQGIRARADREVTVIKAEASQKAETLRGEGDAESNRIYAEAYNRDPSFFAFFRSMQAYETGLGAQAAGGTRLVLSPNSDFFRYFVDPAGKLPGQATPPAARQGAPAANP
ncbi:protease modulator HflC [Chelatococcus asaccharovorans]|uniref:Protein HflC n=1 Tax=Chelatococcus asaccharovorans TaxID=28210 RepID=A0A2V3U187_9HYPH|nr:protease modulator HflC [Chelatococcus asaccharovorans]MBS7704277.1 protease modulator HflC [Chelatococcus asaccharovorans]PXW55847.1 protease FtsH subunit HflC [Chelatococcus asaccharovorans]CAH1664957.1 Protein HflC [Chelatococcus asaccharovorans]CAH1682181.1 Protein HflC [Chelatococcus asaccharovorans]